MLGLHPVELNACLSRMGDVVALYRLSSHQRIAQVLLDELPGLWVEFKVFLHGRVNQLSLTGLSGI